ncbi:hypothetical protein AGMMS49957_08310 [Synergistales bacterium]|nr:hypothetical protein AGMMS49957_08310 [Synergistales bacterium]
MKKSHSLIIALMLAAPLCASPGQAGQKSPSVDGDSRESLPLIERLLSVGDDVVQELAGGDHEKWRDEKRRDERERERRERERERHRRERDRNHGRRGRKNDCNTGVGTVGTAGLLLASLPLLTRRRRKDNVKEINEPRHGKMRRF